jgi:hypothetical protein
MENSIDSAGIRAGRGSILAVAALIGAMIADFAETAIDPANTSDGAKFYVAAAHHHDRMLASSMLLLASALLLVPGVFGVAGMLRARGRGLGLGASILALLGGAGHVALAAFYLVFTTIPTSGQPRAEGVALINHIVHAGETKLLAPLAIAFPLAILVTLVATVRGRLVGRRLLILVAAAPVAAIAAPGPDAVKTTCALVFFLLAAALVLRATANAAARLTPTG